MKRVTVQRLLVLVLSLFMLLVPPVAAHGLDLSLAAAPTSQLSPPLAPDHPDQRQDDEASAILLASTPETPTPAGDDDGSGGDGLDLPESLSLVHFAPAAPETRSHRTGWHGASTGRPWSTGPPRA